VFSLGNLIPVGQFYPFVEDPASGAEIFFFLDDAHLFPDGLRTRSLFFSLDPFWWCFLFRAKAYFRGIYSSLI